MFKKFCWRVQVTEITCFSYFFINFALALTNIQCNTQGDCNNGKSINCGICTKNDNAVIGKCIFPFPYMFKESEKCIVIDKCEENCDQHGVCSFESNTIIPYCECNEGFYGKICDNIAGKHMTRMFFFKTRVDFIGIQKPFEETTRGVYLHCYPEQSDHRALVESEMVGGTFLFQLDFLLEGCETSDEWFTARVINRFPYKHYDPAANDGILLFGDEVLGYLNNFMIKVTFNGILN